jgi:hypothetical protein
MKLEALSRLIESADFLSFREIALKTLSNLGYQNPSLTDGWSDGGTDIRVSTLPPYPNPLAVQITVERDWRGKLSADTKKVKDKLNLSDMVFVCSRRVPEAEFALLSSDILKTTGVRVTKVDNQTIASIFFDKGEVGTILDILGIHPTPSRPLFENIPNAARLDAAYSYIVFGKESEQFRDKITESTIVSLLAKAEHLISREKLVEKVCSVLNLDMSNSITVTKGIEQLIQQGDLHVSQGFLYLANSLKDVTTAVQAVRDKEWVTLRSRVQKKLNQYSKQRKVTDQIVDSVMEDLGSLMLSAADAAFRSFDRSSQRTVSHENMLARLRHLHTSLDSMSVAEGQKRQKLIEELTEIAAASPLGKHIMAGELYLSLSTISPPSLIRAIGGRTNVEIYVDASVAIPILSCLLFEATTSFRYFVAAIHAYRQITSQNMIPLLPRDYLEEVAAHLFMAYRDYSAIIDLDPDLAASENAFVAHYTGLKPKRPGLTFPQYVKAFGLGEALTRVDLPAARTSLMPHLERLFTRYGFKVISWTRLGYHPLKAAEEMMARAIDALKLKRPSILLNHDAKTIAGLSEEYSNANNAPILCTWDSLHFWIFENEKPTWDVMDPSMLGDILSITGSDIQSARITSPLMIARSVSEEAALEGATVWDVLVKIEKGNLHDAELLAMAQEFKREYLTNKQHKIKAWEVETAWLEWKAKYSEAN